ncbi:MULTISPECIES: hypothetical protein [unclassified Streptomyces]
MEDTAYCATLIHDVEPGDALRLLLGDEAEIHGVTRHDMRTLAGEREAG